MNTKSSIILVIAIVLLALVGVYYLMPDKDDNGGNSQVISDWRSYENSAYGYSLQYPGTWAIEPNHDSSTVIFSSIDTNEEFSVSIAAPEVESVIRDAIDIKKEDTLNIDGREGKLFHLNDDDTGLSQKIIIVQDGEKLYYISVYFTQYEKMLSSFKFSANN